MRDHQKNRARYSRVGGIVVIAISVGLFLAVQALAASRIWYPVGLAYTAIIVLAAVGLHILNQSAPDSGRPEE